ncbi:hypothetical protein F2Q68_00044266 [Brassica cretica]|uniref:Uncharacterized protein n=1 Tax=Brassica cretica TaxID=69181 RepID=A0A8S9LSJ8_BRACR|nr:hypothetical protein F2Q68_00044266 [Brassica cretica]
MISGKGNTVFETQDYNANKVLKTGGGQLAYRYLEAVQHTDNDLWDRKPQATAHQNSRTTAGSVAQDLWEVERSSAWRARIYHTTVHNGKDASRGGMIKPQRAIQYASPSAGSTEFSLRHEDISVMDVLG